MSTVIIPPLGPEKSVHLSELIKSKLASLNLYTDDVLPEYIMVLLANRNSREKVYEELVLFMGGPEITEHFVIWLFQEVENLINFTPVTAPVALQEQEQVIRNQTNSYINTDSSINNTASDSNYMQNDSNVPSGIAQDVQMGGNTRLQGTRNFSRALESAISQNSRRSATTNSHFSVASSNSNSTSNDNNNNSSNNTRSSSSSSYSQRSRSRSPPRRSSRFQQKSPTRSSSSLQHQRVVRREDDRSTTMNFDESGGGGGSGKVQKIRLDVDFNRDERQQQIRERRQYKKLPTSTEDGSGSGSGDKVKDVVKVKCSYWPNCRAGKECPNIHPSETCKNFPNCQFGDSCTFLHPSIPCRFQEKCQNIHCNYQHKAPLQALQSLQSLQPLLQHQQHQLNTTNAQSTSTIQCRFYPRCVNPTCSYLHPVKVQCRYGVDCSRPECPFEHQGGRKGAHLKSVVYAPCKYGKQCARADCPFQHEQPNPVFQTNPVDSITNAVVTPTNPEAVESSTTIIDTPMQQ